MKMRILIGCEFSGVVRRAFRSRGHDAWSCDLLPAEDGSKHHYQTDVRDIILSQTAGPWDLGIFHPPCTHLCSSGARHFEQKRADGRQKEGIQFFMAMVNSKIPRIAIENPIGIMSRLYRKPDQIIQPFQFGHREPKATCLWLKNLPRLTPTKIMEPQWKKNPDSSDWTTSNGKRESIAHSNPKLRWENQTASGQNKLPPSPDRWKLRSITYQGIADAMALQWGDEQNLKYSDGMFGILFIK